MPCAGHRPRAAPHRRRCDSPRAAGARGDLQRRGPGRRLCGGGRRARDLSRSRSGARRRARAAGRDGRCGAARPGPPGRVAGILLPPCGGLRDRRRRPKARRQRPAPAARLVPPARVRPARRGRGSDPRGLPPRGRSHADADDAQRRAGTLPGLSTRSWRLSPPDSPRPLAPRSCRGGCRRTRARWWTRSSPRSTAPKPGPCRGGCRTASGPPGRRQVRSPERRGSRSRAEYAGRHRMLMDCLVRPMAGRTQACSACWT